MRKQARRLWFGDWQHDQEPAPDADTVVITPDDDGYERPPRSGRWSVRRAIAAGVAVAVLFVLALSLFSGNDDKRTAFQQSQTPPPTQTPLVPQNQVPPGFGGADLTGADAAKAAKAALSKYPGDVERVTRGPSGGGYVVHVIQADGNEVHVIVGDDFKVQGSDANSGPRNNFGPGRSQ